MSIESKLVSHAASLIYLPLSNFKLVDIYRWYQTILPLWYCRKYWIAFEATDLVGFLVPGGLNSNEWEGHEEWLKGGNKEGFTVTNGGEKVPEEQQGIIGKHENWSEKSK